MQPLDISTSFSSTRLRVAPCPTRRASTLTSLMSLTITATFKPARLLRMWFRTVVFPAPRKPDRTVTGNRGGVFGFRRAVSIAGPRGVGVESGFRQRDG